MGVVSGDDQHLRRGVGSDPERIEELRCDPANEFLEQRVVRSDLGVEIPPPPGEGAKSMLGGGQGCVGLSGPETSTALDERHLRERLKLLSELGVDVHDEGLQGDHGGRSGLHGSVFGHLDLAEHLHDAVAALGGRLGHVGEHARAAFTASRRSLFPFSRRSRRSWRTTSTTL